MMSLRKLTLYLVMSISLTMCLGFGQITTVTAIESSDMQLVYDFGSQTLAVNVSHYSINKNDIIETIEILKNGIFCMNRTYENQSTNEWVYDTFSVSAVVDDNLTVTATCSRGLSITRWVIVTSTTATNTPPSDTTTTTTTEESTDGTDSPGTPLGTEFAVVAGIGVVVFLILFFAWLSPDNIPGVFRQLGSRIRSGLIWTGEKVRNAFSWLKTGLGNLLQQIKAKAPSK